MSHTTTLDASRSLAGKTVTLCSPRVFVQNIARARYASTGVTSQLTDTRSLTTTLDPWTDAWKSDSLALARSLAVADYTYLTRVLDDLTREMATRRIETGRLFKSTKYLGGSRHTLTHKVRKAIVAAHRVDGDGESSACEWTAIAQPGKIPDQVTFPLLEADDDTEPDNAPQPLEWVVKVAPIPVDFSRVQIPENVGSVQLDIDENNQISKVSKECGILLGTWLNSTQLPPVFDSSDETDTDKEGLNDPKSP